LKVAERCTWRNWRELLLACPFVSVGVATRECSRATHALHAILLLCGMAKSGQKRSLKDALKSHQSHTIAYKKAVQAQERRALAAKAPPKRKRSTNAFDGKLLADTRRSKDEKLVKSPILFEEADRILLLGEGLAFHAQDSSISPDRQEISRSPFP
jgi:hypothetical protein